MQNNIAVTQKLNTELLYYARKPLLDINPKQLKYQAYICTPIFTVASFRVAKMCKQSKFPQQMNG
jgi:hypothetical protein